MIDAGIPDPKAIVTRRLCPELMAAPEEKDNKIESALAVACACRAIKKLAEGLSGAHFKCCPNVSVPRTYPAH